MISICLAYLIFTFREFKSIHKGKTAILHLRFGTEKNRRLGSKKARYNRAFRKRHLFCLHIMAESKGFEPSNRFRRLHDFQSCSFDQLGQLSIDQMTRNIIYDFIQKSKQIFSYYSKFALSAHTHIKRSPMRLPSEPKTSIFLQS